jgi:probable blue pigment (indigoidine) exporter
MITAVAPAVWGTTYVVTTELLPPGHPLFAALTRSLPAGLIALALTRTFPVGSWWWKSVVLGVANIGAFFPLLFVAAYRLPGGVAAVLGAIQPIVVVGLSVAILREQLSLKRLAWGLIGLLGVALVVLKSNAVLDIVGIIAGLAGAVSMAVGVTLTKRWGRPGGVSLTTLAAWQLTAGGLFILPLAVLFGSAPPSVDGEALAGYAWLGIAGGLAAYMLWFRGIGRLPATSIAALALLSPLIAALLGAVVLGETFGALQLTGLALALAAIVAGQVIAPPKASLRHASRRQASSTSAERGGA